MKKVIFAALMLISISSFAAVNGGAVSNAISKCGGGRHISASQVPAPVMASFNQHFPTATNVSWEVSRDNGVVVFEAKLRENGSCKKAEFLKDGTLTEQKIISCSGSGSGSGR